ncbi:MAG: hypothetical protein P1V51_18670 [Deltaproteobacteria bacterium]|nr:hypothetical protein [Deltaproteobacteria bacterium]
MASFDGKVKFEDLEGGLWLLLTSDGQRLQLSGGDAGLRKDGLHVTVKGRLAEDMMSIGMTGPILEVESWKSK